HLRIACDLMRTIEKRDPEEILPIIGFDAGLKLQSNKAYVRDVLASQVDLTAKDAEFVPVSTLPNDDRYFDYQRRVNDQWVPTEEVISRNAEKNGREYRVETEGPHPVPGLRGAPSERDGEAIDYSRRTHHAA